jgi:hypothetical protein
VQHPARAGSSKNHETPVREEIGFEVLRAGWGLISSDSDEEPLRNFYVAVFPTQKNAATFSL